MFHGGRPLHQAACLPNWLISGRERVWDGPSYSARPVLFQPLTLRCGVVLPNRIALAPMTNRQSLPDGLLGDDELHWLARRAEGGYGMVATCAAYVALDGKAWPGELGIDRDACLPGLHAARDAHPWRGASAWSSCFTAACAPTQR